MRPDGPKQCLLLVTDIEPRNENPNILCRKSERRSEDSMASSCPRKPIDNIKMRFQSDPVKNAQCKHQSEVCTYACRGFPSILGRSFGLTKWPFYPTLQLYFPVWYPDFLIVFVCHLVWSIVKLLRLVNKIYI